MSKKVTIAADTTYTISIGAQPAAIDFGGVGATLLINPDITTTATIGTLVQGDFIDAVGITNGTVAASGTLLVLDGSNGSLSLNLDTAYGGQFRASSDGNGGTLISYTDNSQPCDVPIYHETNTGSDAT